MSYYEVEEKQHSERELGMEMDVNGKIREGLRWRDSSKWDHEVEEDQGQDDNDDEEEEEEEEVSTVIRHWQLHFHRV
jgi:hypothetical protein